MAAPALGVPATALLADPLRPAAQSLRRRPGPRPGVALHREPTAAGAALQGPSLQPCWLEAASRAEQFFGSRHREHCTTASRHAITRHLTPQQPSLDTPKCSPTPPSAAMDPRGAPRCQSQHHRMSQCRPPGQTTHRRHWKLHSACGSCGSSHRLLVSDQPKAMACRYAAPHQHMHLDGQPRPQRIPARPHGPRCAEPLAVLCAATTTNQTSPSPPVGSEGLGMAGTVSRHGS